MDNKPTDNNQLSENPTEFLELSKKASLFGNVSFFDPESKKYRDRNDVKEFMKGAEYDNTSKFLPNAFKLIICVLVAVFASMALSFIPMYSRLCIQNPLHF